jgi:uncharacterized protein (TIGR03435 family)
MKGLAVLLSVTSLVVTHAQTPLVFEVASIKPNISAASQSTMGIPPSGRFIARNVSLQELIGYAYGTPAPFIPLARNRIIGGPDWLPVAKFDVEAIPATGLSEGEFPKILTMLQTLLASRFALRVHSEQRELPVYVLTFGRPDRQLGPSLRRATAGCSAAAAKQPGASCGMERQRGFMNARGMRMEQILLHGLAPVLDRVVVDETGLEGEFDWRIEWMGDQALQPLDGREVPAAGSLGPSIFTAVEEQLGLKLESSRRPVQVLVIDSAARPTPD